MGDVRLIQYLTQNCEIDFTYTLKQDLLYHGRTIIGKGQPIYQLVLRYCLNFQKLLDVRFSSALGHFREGLRSDVQVSRRELPARRD